MRKKNVPVLSVLKGGTHWRTTVMLCQKGQVMFTIYLRQVGQDQSLKFLRIASRKWCSKVWMWCKNTISLSRRRISLTTSNLILKGHCLTFHSQPLHFSLNRVLLSCLDLFYTGYIAWECSVKILKSNSLPSSNIASFLKKKTKKNTASEKTTLIRTLRLLSKT